MPTIPTKDLNELVDEFLKSLSDVDEIGNIAPFEKSTPGKGPNCLPKDYRGPSSRLYRGFSPAASVPNCHKPQDLPKLKYIYLHYFKYDDHGRLTFRFFGGENDSTEDEIARAETWIQEARQRNQNQVPSDDLAEIEWGGPSVLAFFVDHSAWNLIPRTDSERPVACMSLAFADDQLGNMRPYENRCFFNAKNCALPNVTDEQSGDAMRILLTSNFHFKAARGLHMGPFQSRSKPLPEDDYKFDLYYDVDVSGYSGSEKFIAVLDPSGRNVGP